jgi:hypothetical protein
MIGRRTSFFIISGLLCAGLVSASGCAPQPTQPPATATPTVSIYPTSTPIPSPMPTTTNTPTPTPVTVSVKARNGLHVYTGPGEMFDSPAYDATSRPHLIVGRNTDGTWLMAAENFYSGACEEKPCWIKTSEVIIDPAVVTSLPMTDSEYANIQALIVARIIQEGAKLRYGPGDDYAVITVLPTGLSVVPTNRDQDGGWLYIRFEASDATRNASEGWVQVAQTDFPAEKAAGLIIYSYINPAPPAIPGWSGDPVGTVCLNLHGNMTGKFAQDFPNATVFTSDNSMTSFIYSEIDGNLNWILAHGMNLYVERPGNRCDADLDINLTINMLGTTYTEKYRQGGGIYCYDGASVQNTMTLSNGSTKLSASASQERYPRAEIEGCANVSEFADEATITSIKNMRRIWGDQVLSAAMNTGWFMPDGAVYAYLDTELKALGLR